ncbi:NEP1-interacting protein-like 1 [Juglans microcarpa x Juglans regia]|uniref:NEP1-interacting protein-like 1 n=1 Tax=Juglans microcarpa x Juglans regia TaxID=2249226 RepID=UPI001B7F6642|nr:NEP1-interacting protein-like 1 [Juglans microcarpa x Juglans regia]
MAFSSIFPAMKGRFSGITKAALWSKETAIDVFGTGFFTRAMKRVASVIFTCILALGGAIVGVFVGAIKGQTTETGFLNGAGIGAVTGAIAGIHLLESAADCESLSKTALLGSLMNGKVFVEWVCPAVLKAYQWQVGNLETSYQEAYDIYDIGGVKGLSNSSIQKLPIHIFHSSKMIKSCHDFCCSICLQDFKDENSVRELPNCGHLFHVGCVDKWLSRQGTCPMCRECVCDDIDAL